MLETPSGEVLPGIGTAMAQVGQTLEQIEAVAGPPSVTDGPRGLWNEHTPAFVVHTDADGIAELVEIAHGESGEPQATLHGIQLTFRLMDDVVADLERAGFHGVAADIGWEYDEGFYVWSMASHTANDLDPGGTADPDDERLVVEGVSVAPISYWRES
jgi:hypothetical protein